MEECLICRDEIEENDKVVTKCNHLFHHECLKDAFKQIVKHKKTHGFGTNAYNECPYCRNDAGYLPLKEGEVAEQYVHTGKKSMINKTICGAIKKNGQPCTNSQKPNNPNGYCGVHNKN